MQEMGAEVGKGVEVKCRIRAKFRGDIKVDGLAAKVGDVQELRAKLDLGIGVS